jgi:hypothetical protein
VWQKLLADDGTHFADVGHSLGQILHHGHLKYTSSCNVIGIWPPNSGQPFGQHHNCSTLLADDAAYLANGLHGTDQILHSHSCITSELRLLFI